MEVTPSKVFLCKYLYAVIEDFMSYESTHYTLLLCLLPIDIGHH